MRIFFCLPVLLAWILLPLPGAEPAAEGAIAVHTELPERRYS